METTIIRLYDEDYYDYPLIEIKRGFYNRFVQDLDEYKKEDCYNIDDFIKILETKNYFIRAIYPSIKTYF